MEFGIDGLLFGFHYVRFYDIDFTGELPLEM